jgi:hypothetical protein
MDLKRLSECSIFERLSRHFLNMAVLAVLIFTATSAFCDSVTRETARQVAQNKLVHHVSLYGHWNRSSSPTIIGEQVIYHNGEPVAYNFSVDPGGHIMVAMDDFFSPVLLYSTTSTIDAGRLDDPQSIESWILPELGRQVRTLNQVRASTTESTARYLTVSETAQRISAAWQLLANPDYSVSVSRSLSTSILERGETLTIGPLLETTWGQDAPYNLMAPENGCPNDERTMTGCVATAWAQLMRYWQWPVLGTGNHSYEWNEQTLSADFSTTTYDWDDMPAVLNNSSSAAEKDAVSLLMYHTGIAAEMVFGCESSGSLAWADDVLDVYFGYQNGMTLHERRNYSSSAWLDLITSELDADPPRPLLLAIITTESAGHEVVVDGYQTGATTTDMVHINYGWNGYYNGYYNITDSFETAPYTWVANDQTIVIGIQPDGNYPPSVTISDDQQVEEETEVQLGATATDPDGIGIRSLVWTQSAGPTVTLSDSGAAEPTFTAPNVHEETQLAFSLRAYDANLGLSTATTTVTINNTDGSTAPVSRSSGGGGSSGCFLGILVE